MSDWFGTNARASLAFVLAALARRRMRAAKAAIQAPGRAAGVRLYVFDGGILESDPGRYRLTKEDVGDDAAVGCAYPRSRTRAAC